VSTTADGWCDFNDIEDGNAVTVLLEHCTVYPMVGEPYTMGDGDGNWCRGHVESFNGWIARVRLDLTTWHNAGE
jgi:SH3-like domain-containing protein